MLASEDQLIGKYAPLVRRQALQLAARLPASVDVDDLMQAGMMGLLDAVRRYQQTAEAQFETYAVTRIRGAMLDELRSQDWLPRSVRTKSKTIEQAIRSLNNRLLRPATEQEIADELDMPLDAYQAMLEDARGVQVVHYEDLVRQHDEQSDPLEQLHAAQDERSDWINPLDQLLTQGLREALVDAIAALPEREQLLLSLQFEQDLNQKEIAAVLGVTEGRVSQLRSQAVSRIRATLSKGAWNERPSELAVHALL